MRISCIFALISLTCMHVSADVNAQQISITTKDAPIEQVFELIQKKSGFEFFYDARQIKDARKITMNFEKAELKTVLDHCFRDQPFSYSIQNKTIVLTLLPQPIPKKGAESRPPIKVRGKVTSINNDPLIGVSVRLRGTDIGTITDQNGNYQIEGDSEGILVFTFVGFQAMQIKINGQTEINLTLIEYTSELKETVIKGYYNTTKELNTGNVSEIKSEAIGRQPVVDAIAVLQGQIPGLYIQQTSGVPGRSITVKLRGQNSIANGNDPLYIVDGVPFNPTPLDRPGVTSGASSIPSPFSDINPSDIESIQVLKDADATAIYGSRGANGVILINTKRGSTGSTKVDLNVIAGAGKVTRMRELLNTDQYLAMRREAFKNDNLSPGASDYDLNGTYKLDKYTDWQKVMIGGTAQTRNVQLAFSGGSKSTRYRLSGGYNKEGTVFPGNFFAQKASASASFNHNSDNNKLKIDFSGTYTAGLSKLPGVDMAQFIFLAPNAPDIFDSSGKLNFANNTWSNPFAQITYRNKEVSNNLNTNGNISYEILKGLQFRTSMGFNSVNLDASHIVPSTSFNNNGLTAAQIAAGRSHAVSKGNIRTYILEPQLSYSAILFKGTLDALVGSTYQESNQTIFSVTASNFVSDDLIENLLSASAIRVNGNPITKYRYNAVYGRIGYTFKNRYILNLTGRRDGSSRFGPGKQFGNFGAIGAAWIFSHEKFVKDNLQFLSFGKLRGSLGSTGNDRLPDYRYLSTYSTYAFNYQGNNSLYPTQLTNPFYSWEKVNKLEAGLELGLFEDRLSLNTSWYRNRTNNQLVGYSLPDITGFRTIQANLPAVVQNTGLEIEAMYKIKEKASFNWSTSINFSFPKSKLVSYPNLAGSSYATRYVIGMPLDVRKFYHFTGVDPNTKLFTFQDVNGDNKITNPQDLQPIRVGQEFFGGWSHNISYKNIQLDLLLVFAKQTGQIIPINSIPGGYTQGAGNQPTSVLNGGFPQPFTQSFSSPAFTQLVTFLSSDGMFSDASYIRLRNVTLSWKIFENRKGLKLARIFTQCQNLFTITNFKGLDPETAKLGALNTVPPIRVITAGLQLTL